MRLALLALLLSLPAAAQDFDLAPEFSFAPEFGPQGQLAPSLLLLSPGQVAVSPLPCTAAGQLNLLSGSYACLNGDGTQSSSSGMTLSAVGSSTTQTMETSPNGSNNRAVSQKRWTASDSYQSTSLSAPSGDFSVCHVGMVDAPLSAVTLVSGPGYSLSVTSAGVATFTSGGSSVSSASGAVIGGADQVICGTRAGTAGVVYVGATGVLGTVAAPSGSAALKVGGFAGGTRGALVTSRVLSAAEVRMLVAALVPVPQTATGQSISNSRNSATWVTTSGGALVALPPGRTGVVGPPGETGVVGGVAPAPQRTNLLTWSETFGSGTTPQGSWVAAGTITFSKGDAACGVAPDGSGNATLLSCTSGPCGLTQETGASTAQMASVWLKAPSTGSVATGINVGTSVTGSTATTVTPGATWARVSGSNANTTGQAFALGYIGTWATGKSVCAFAAQEEAGSIASPYCRSEGTSATCAGDVITIPTPSWLSTREGCAKVCVTVPFTGNNPSSGSIFLLNGNSANTARFFYLPTALGLSAYDGTHTATAPGSLTANVRACYVTRWSASGGYLRIDSATTGAQGTPVAFSGFPSFDSSLGIGNSGGSFQPLGSIIDSITLGSTPGGCQ